ncbi:rhamnosyltransferase [Muricomes intestini]|uniref:Rhamnosyltransferase n=1 Tax=Muricomes intestini TaxID=1796634 RepID=A0A4R3K2G7_9FIRM|nr:glycosyltransferase [Muricomes intestini]TCS76629.1 rhamnosyltransferase [Muricomes intestini]
MNENVLIMMATYDGEKYIGEQIESILAQDYSNWHLIIQDDGSNDRTGEIITKYCDLDDRIEFCINNAEVHGAYINFHGLANQCKNGKEYDYYMFADQDDIWLQNKLSKLINYMNINSKTEVATLCYGDMEVINDNGECTATSIDQILGLKYYNPYSVFFSHNVFGCNIIMNKKLFLMVPIVDITKDSTKILSHDNLYTKYSATFGQVLYLPERLMQYRRHSANVTSKQSYIFSVQRIIKRFLKLNDLAKDHALTYNQSLIAIQMMKDQASVEEWKFLQGIQNAINHGGIIYLNYSMAYRITWGKKVKTLSRTLILLTGLYKKYLLVNNK